MKCIALINRDSRMYGHKAVMKLIVRATGDKVPLCEEHKESYADGGTIAYGAEHTINDR